MRDAGGRMSQTKAAEGRESDSSLDDSRLDDHALVVALDSQREKIQIESASVKVETFPIQALEPDRVGRGSKHVDHLASRLAQENMLLDHPPSHSNPAFCPPQFFGR